MSGISLTASMRSNLLSLQQIAKLQDATQLRLSTGLKVNSAIDNPSSYYTAQSLTNRADDLSALLDSMGQSVQTIKAATEGIEKAEDLLSQMKAIAEQVNTGVYVPEKSYFEEKVGANGAVVTTADELRAAVDSGKEEICVYGKIDLGDISTAGGLELQENQKLVGVNYYGNFGTEGEEFSGISATSSAANNMIDIRKTGTLVSDLKLSYKSDASARHAVINVRQTDIEASVKNLDIKIDLEINTGDRKAAITGYGEINLLGNINITTTGNGVSGILNTGIANINSDCVLNINTDGTESHAILGTGGKTQINVLEGALVNINTAGQAGRGISIQEGTEVNILGNIYIHTLHAEGIVLDVSVSNVVEMNVGSTAQLYINVGNSAIFGNAKNNSTQGNILNITSGAKIAVEKDGQTKWYEVQEDYQDINDSGTTHNITADNIEATLNVTTTEAWKTAGDVVKEQEQEKAVQAEKEAEEQANREVYQKQFNNALLQYDSLIKDSSYKGVNLLQADDLKVIFNENRSSTLDVSGVDLSSDKIGMMTADWTKAKDVQNSINQVIEAKNTLRSASTKLGNYYSIITERETFTDNLINVLEEGADKLTLADMNEESANMLSLQTQQQLAINSLSLASQASQAVLRLF